MADKPGPKLEYQTLAKGAEDSVRDRLVGRFWISLALLCTDLDERPTAVPRTGS